MGGAKPEPLKPAAKPLKPEFIHTVAKSLAEGLVRRLERVCERIEIAGSIRRETDVAHDIELVAIPKRKENEDLFGHDGSSENLLWKELDSICSSNPDMRYLKAGDKYRQIQVKTPKGTMIKVDIFIASRGNWGWIYLVRTGSADFSHKMARSLNQAGYTSKDGWIRAISNPDVPVETPEEKDVFRLAARQLLAPQYRK